MTDINWLLAQLDRDAWLEAAIQAGAERSALSPGHLVVQTICLLWRTRAAIHCAQDSSECTYSPMTFANTRFRHRPSRLQCQLDG
jgi:hypothetical protein